jgi:hypothetical protein
VEMAKIFPGLVCFLNWRALIYMFLFSLIFFALKYPNQGNNADLKKSEVLLTACVT